MRVDVEHLGALQFEIRARQHVIVSDQPTEGGGFDEGMTPPELLLGSLASCAAYYAAEYLKRNGLAQEGTRVTLTAEKAKNPARLEDFEITVKSPAVLTPAHRKGLEEAVNRCVVHNTLTHPPRIRTEVTDSEQVGFTEHQILSA